MNFTNFILSLTYLLILRQQMCLQTIVLLHFLCAGRQERQVDDVPRKLIIAMPHQNSCRLWIKAHSQFVGKGWWWNLSTITEISRSNVTTVLLQVSRVENSMRPWDPYSLHPTTTCCSESWPCSSQISNLWRVSCCDKPVSVHDLQKEKCIYMFCRIKVSSVTTRFIRPAIVKEACAINKE